MSVRRLPWPVLAALAFLCILAYANSFDAGFTFDSKALLVKDRRVQEMSPQNVRRILQTTYWWPILTHEYRPVTTLTYMLNRAAAGNDPVSFHVFNLALHWLVAVLVCRVALLWLPSVRAALLAAGLFAVHPVATEAVTNIVGRADLISAAAILGALLLHARLAEPSVGRRTAYLTALGVVTAVGVFAKENAFVVPILLLLYDMSHSFKGRLTPGALWAALYKPSYAVVAVVFAACGLARWFIYRPLGPVTIPFVDNPLIGADSITARLTAIKVLGKYLWLLVWPRQLSCDYSYNQIPLVRWPFSGGWENTQTLVAAAALAGLACLAVLCFRRNRPAFFFLGFFFVALAPTSNLLRIIGSIMAERFLYLPLVAFAALVVLLVDWSWARLLHGRHTMAANITLGFVAALWCGRTLIRNLDWRNEISLWSSAARVSPESYKAHKGLAAAWYNSSPDTIVTEQVLAEVITAQNILEPLPNVRRDHSPLTDLGTYYRLQGEFIEKNGGGSSAAGERSLELYRKSADSLRRATEVASAQFYVHSRPGIRRVRDAAPVGGEPWPFVQLALTCARLRDFENARGA